MAEVPPDGGGEPSSDEREDEPKELSSRGRFVVRSSSHPPRTQGGDVSDVSGARSLPRPGDPAGLEPRAKRTTPTERPRRRRDVQARSLDRPRIETPWDRPRVDTPRARPGARRRSDPSQPAVAPNAEPAASAASVSPAPGSAARSDAPLPNVESQRLRRALVVLALVVAAAAIWLALRG